MSDFLSSADFLAQAGQSRLGPAKTIHIDSATPGLMVEQSSGLLYAEQVAPPPVHCPKCGAVFEGVGQGQIQYPHPGSPASAYRFKHVEGIRFVFKAAKCGCMLSHDWTAALQEAVNHNRSGKPPYTPIDLTPKARERRYQFLQAVLTEITGKFNHPALVNNLGLRTRWLAALDSIGELYPNAPKNTIQVSDPKLKDWADKHITYINVVLTDAATSANTGYGPDYPMPANLGQPTVSTPMPSFNPVNGQISAASQAKTSLDIGAASDLPDTVTLAGVALAAGLGLPPKAPQPATSLNATTTLAHNLAETRKLLEAKQNALIGMPMGPARKALQAEIIQLSGSVQAQTQLLKQPVDAMSNKVADALGVAAPKQAPADIYAHTQKRWISDEVQKLSGSDKLRWLQQLAYGGVHYPDHVQEAIARFAELKMIELEEANQIKPMYSTEWLKSVLGMDQQLFAKFVNTVLMGDKGDRTAVQATCGHIRKQVSRYVSYKGEGEIVQFSDNTHKVLLGLKKVSIGNYGNVTVALGPDGTLTSDANQIKKAAFHKQFEKKKRRIRRIDLGKKEETDE
jgi:hypothetical protein